MKEEPNAALETCMKDWEDLSAEYLDLEELHKSYRNKLEEALSLQKKVNSGVKHQRYRLGAVQKMMDDIDGAADEEKDLKSDLKKDVFRRKAQLTQMEDFLPRESGRYLKTVLGNLNVSILDKDTKYNYKEQYEQFKLTVNIVATITAGVSLFAENLILDRCYMFLVLWYYCTLTIRESILRVNGTRIRGWWRAHHFVSTILAGVLLVWPNGNCFIAFRSTLLWFGIYLGFVSYVQFTYQRGCLYRLKSLGVRNHDMDITIDGFHSWMWKGLTFLLPFLIICYGWQLYNAYILYYLSQREDAEWHVAILSFLFLGIGMGNICTTIWTITSKIRDRQMGYFKLRFTRLDKYFWTHKRRGPESKIVKSYSRGAQRIRTISVSGRQSPFLNELQIPAVHVETVVEQTSAAADDSPDHQILMAPRNSKRSSLVDNVITETNTESSSIDTKKDI